MALSAINRGGRVQSLLADTDSGGLYTLDVTHGAIHEGRAYSYYFTTSAAAGASGAWYFQTASGVECHFRIVGMSVGGAAKFTFYEGKTATSASGMSSSGVSASATGVNRDRLGYSTSTGSITFHTGSGFASGSGTALDFHSFGTASGTGGTKSGGTGPADEEWELLAGNSYAIHWVSPTADNVITVRVFWYEFDYDG